MPTNTSESRHSVVMPSRCGWWRLCAIFSGSTWTIQNSTIAPAGTTNSTTSARMSAIVSSASPERNDACAGAASSVASTPAAILSMEPILPPYSNPGNRTLVLSPSRHFRPDGLFVIGRPAHVTSALFSLYPASAPGAARLDVERGLFRALGDVDSHIDPESPGH